MVWLTQDPALVQHATSADGSNALLQRSLPTTFKSTVATISQALIGFIYSRADRAALLRLPAGGAQCLRPLEVPPPTQAADGCGTRWSACGSSKYMSKPEGRKGGSWRRVAWSQNASWRPPAKPEIPPWIKPEVRVEDRTSPKRACKRQWA